MQLSANPGVGAVFFALKVKDGCPLLYVEILYFPPLTRRCQSMEQKLLLLEFTTVYLPGELA